MKRIYTSIDVGSDSVKIVVCELYKNKLNLLAATSVTNNGVKKGLITDINLVKTSVKKAVDKIENMLGIRIDKAVTTIPSYFAEFLIVNGKTMIENEQNIVTGKEVSDVIRSSIRIFNDSTKEMITLLPIDFKVDEEVTKDPKGLKGKELSMRGVLVTTPKKNIYSVVGLLESLNIEVTDISLGSIGDYAALKNKDLDSKVGAIVNIGSEITTVSLLNKGIIIKNSVIQRGGSNIDSDISYIYKINQNDAKEIKENYALAHRNYANNSEIIEIVNRLGDNVQINQRELSDIVYSRLEEMLNLIKKEINGLANREIDYIIVTGGTTNIPYFENIVEPILGKNAKIGEMKVVGIRNNKYSSCLGNIISFIQKLRLKGKSYTMIDDEDALVLSSPRKNNVNETNIWKALIGFFDE